MSRTAMIVAAIAVIVTVCLMGGLAITSGIVSGATCMPPAATSATASPPPTEPPSAGWDREQVSHAATIVAVGQQRGVPPRGWIIALATAMQESSLRNLEHGDRDSLGLFQQRPRIGWGTRKQILDPVYAAGAFYDKLVTIDGWQQLPLAQAAQAVQVSAHPEAYTKWEPQAVALAAAVTGTTAELLALCGASGWVLPVDGPIVSGFRTDQRPDHDGIDIAAAKGTPVRAAAAGTVATIRCNARLPDGSPYSCDVDGSPTVLGCGWYADLRHNADTTTRYCQMSTRPAVVEGQTVTTGQVIGTVGSSGNSSGPHLHFEVHIVNTPVDPMPFMATRAPIGKPQ